MDENIIVDLWLMFKEYADKKNIEIAAEKFIDLLADYGITDETLRDALGHDQYLDSAITYYLDLDEEDEDEDW